MALDYRKCAEELVPLLGGKENLISAAHCATRLRLVVADNSKIDQKAIENVEGVKGTFQSNGQFQIIIGTGTVNKVYDELPRLRSGDACSRRSVTSSSRFFLPSLHPV